MFRIQYVYLFIYFFLIFHIKCFVTSTYHNNGLYNKCSSLLCSNNKLENIYEDSKFILAELENLIHYIRDEKNSHQIENEYDKKLDFEIKFPTSKDYEDLEYLTPDEEFENDNDYRELLPYITIDRSSEDLEDFEKSILNDNKNKLDNSANRPLKSDEEIDVALSKLYDLEEEQKRFMEDKKEYNLKRYLR